MKIRIRPLKYIYNSRVDFIDLWVSVLSILTGIVLMLNNPLETISVYENLTKSGITSSRLGAFSLLVGSANVAKIFFPIRPNIYLTLILKVLSFSIFCLLFFTVVGNPPLPVSTVFYFMVAGLSLDNIIRIK